MKNLTILCLLLIPLISTMGQSVDMLGYPASDKVFITWPGHGEDIMGLYRLNENEKPDLREKKPMYVSKEIRNGYEIKEILGERYEYISRLLGVTSPEEIPYAIDNLSGIENVICTLIPELAVVRGRGYVDYKVQEGNTYQYVIATMIKKGNSFKADKVQASISVTARDLPLLPPVLHHVIGWENKIELYFDNSESPNAGIDIYRAESQSGPFVKVNIEKIMIAGNYPADMPGFTDEHIIPNKTYWYAIKSADIFGRESVFSEVMRAKAYGCDIKKKPDMQRIFPDKSGYVLKWFHQFDKNVSHYIVYRSDKYQTVGEQIGQVPTNSSGEYSFVLKNISNDYEYYTISAVSKNGNCEVYSFQQIFRPSVLE